MVVEEHNETGRAALSALFDAHAERLYGLARVRCGDPSVAEEVTAQAFESAAEAFASGRGDEVTGPWLTTVVLRRLVDHWRRTGRRARLAERVAATEPTVVDPPDPPDDALHRALDSLPANQRAVLALRYLDDWSVAEIADGLDLTYRAAESLLARARRSIRIALAEEGR